MAEIKVFLSSTGRDLHLYRDAVFFAISKLKGMRCIRMEDFGAVDETPLMVCFDNVKECDIFVAVVGHFRGSNPPDDQISFTEHEYLCACKYNKARLIFVSPDDFLIPANLRETDEKWKLQCQFRQIVMRDRTIATFRTPDDLAKEVVAALHNWRPHQNESSSGEQLHIVGHFHIIEKYTGGLANVYVARDSLGKIVAIKRPRPELLKDKPEYEEFFRREAKILVNLNHHGIITLINFFEDKDGPAIVLTYAGNRLSSVLEDVVSLSSAKKLAFTIADAIDYCAERGLSHRDIKPSNIMVDSEQNACLVDFGIAAYFDSDEDWLKVVGTEAYISPDVFSALPKKYRKYCDQFSFGLMLYELLTGQLPFGWCVDASTGIVQRSSTAKMLLACHEMPSYEERMPSITRDADKVLLRMMSIDPASRYPTLAIACRELNLALERWHFRKPIVPSIESAKKVDPSLVASGDTDVEFDKTELSRVDKTFFGVNLARRAEVKGEPKYIPTRLEILPPGIMLPPP